MSALRRVEFNAQAPYNFARTGAGNQVVGASTFKSAEVLYRLESYVNVKYQAQDMNDPLIKADLDRFGIIGLPTYVVLSAPDDDLQ